MYICVDVYKLKFYKEFEYVIFWKLDGMFFKKTTRGKSLYFNKKIFYIFGTERFYKKNYLKISGIEPKR